MGSINQPVSNLSTLQTKANQLLPLASTSLTTMSSGFTQLQNAVDNQLVPGSQSIENGVNAYTKGLDTISLGVNQLSEKNTTLTTSWINWFLAQPSWQKLFKLTTGWIL